MQKKRYVHRAGVFTRSRTYAVLTTTMGGSETACLRIFDSSAKAPKTSIT